MDCGLSCMYVIIAVVHYNDVYVLKSVQIKKKACNIHTPLYSSQLQHQKLALDRTLQTKFLNYRPFKTADVTVKKLYIRRLAHKNPGATFTLLACQLAIKNILCSLTV